MPARGLVLAFVLLLALALGVWALLASGDAAPVPPTAAQTASPGTEPASAAAAADATTNAAPTTAAGSGPARDAVAVPPAADARRTATVRGRCVDANGAPLAGCSASVQGWQANQSRVDAWLRDHPPVEWTKLEPTVTGADGTFAIVFWPPPPFQFTLDVHRDDCTPMGARWSAIAEGAVVDVGDVVMGPGVRLQGSVVDEHGKPVVKAYLNVHVDGVAGGGTDAPRIGQRTYVSAFSGEDGAFRCRQLLPPGSFRVVVTSGQELVQPVTGTLSLERPVEEVVVVVRDLASLPSITGRVVDQHGQPVARAQIDAREPDHGESFSASTKRDGTFTLHKRKGEADRVLLAVRHDDCEEARLPEPVAWGTKDVAVTLQRGGGLAVYVHDDAGTAVTDFVVRVYPRESLRHSSTDSRVRARGPFAAGFAAVPGIARGKWTVAVEFPSALRLVPVLLPIEVTTTTGTRVDVKAPATVQRTLRVVDAAEQPVAGTQVQLCTQVAGAWSDRTHVALGMEQLQWGDQQNRALLLAQGATGADGTFVLEGPRGVPLGLALLGPGHVPLRLADVRLDDAAELVVRVAKGARLEGRLEPPAAVAELRRLAGTGDERRPSLRLRQGKGVEAVRHPSDHRAELAVAEDGGFAIDGAPAGTWTVELHYWITQGTSAHGTHEDVGEVVLRDGETTRFDPSLEHFVPGSLRGRVFENGKPFANGTLQLEGPANLWPVLQTDADGRYSAQLRAGTYHAFRNVEAGGAWIGLRAAERATVVKGATTEQDFRFWSGELAVTLRDQHGAAAEGVSIQLLGDDRRQPAWLCATNASGASASVVPARGLTLRVLPKRLQSQEAKQQVYRDAAAAGGTPGRDPLEPHFLTIGTVTVVAGETTKVELRLPPEWEK